MTISDVIAIIIIVAILATACIYIYKQKKKGKKCIGCPESGTCPKCKAMKKDDSL